MTRPALYPLRRTKRLARGKPTPIAASGRARSDRIASSTTANARPATEGVNDTPSAVSAAKNETASAGKTHADRGIRPCALRSDRKQHDRECQTRDRGCE